MSNVKEIMNKMEAPSREDTELIKSAYDYAQKAHEGQKRYSGEPYFIHVFETAKILAELGMGSKTIAAGLLHDTIEDTDITSADMKEGFSDEILFLVQGVTKLGHIRYQGAKRYSGSLRKLFVATSQDIRVLIIKLADRLHNMRTLEHVPEEKQKRIASETMEVYAPIAHRLNMGKLVGELEDLAFPFIHPEDYEKVVELSKEKYEESIKELEIIYKRLKDALAKEKIHEFETDYRRKGLYSLYQKLQRKDMDINRVYDISALRIIVPTVSDCYKVLGVVHSIWRPLPGRIKDYIAFPKPNGYQSIHTTIFTGRGGIAEIQIRTEKMHREAEYGIASHVNYKMKNGNKSGSSGWLRQLLLNNENNNLSTDLAKSSVPEWIQELAEAQKDLETHSEFMDELKSDFFENRIFVFTPDGDVIDLPANSTPIDFAYHIHTDIGDHVSGAKVNGKLVSLDTKLENGDIVKIETKRDLAPTRKWLDHTKTSIARRKIRSALQKKQEENS